jgi:hypothetical protein
MHIIFYPMIDPTKRSPADWLSDLEESEAQIDAGLTVPLAPALKRLRESIRRLEAEARDRNPRDAARRG